MKFPPRYPIESPEVSGVFVSHEKDMNEGAGIDEQVTFVTTGRMADSPSPAYILEWAYMRFHSRYVTAPK